VCVVDDDGARISLIATCGNVSYSQVASRAALDLLCRLLDVEKNKGATFHFSWCLLLLLLLLLLLMLLLLFRLVSL
jgi:hypothetical protein